jgi:hypothetical protein
MGFLCAELHMPASATYNIGSVFMERQKWIPLLSYICHRQPRTVLEVLLWKGNNEFFCWATCHRQPRTILEVLLWKGNNELFCWATCHRQPRTILEVLLWKGNNELFCWATYVIVSHVQYWKCCYGKATMNSFVELHMSSSATYNIGSVVMERQQWIPLLSYICRCQQYKMYLGVHVRSSIFLSDFDQIWIL